MNTTNMINEKNYLDILLKDIPEFAQIYNKEKEDCDIGPNITLGYLRRLLEEALKNHNTELTRKIANFIIRCWKESRDEVGNAVFVTFFENMNEQTFKEFSKSIPPKLVKEVEKFYKNFDKNMEEYYRKMKT